MKQLKKVLGNIFFLLFIIILCYPSTISASHIKNLRNVEISMNPSQVEELAGKPTKTIEVERWYYGSDQVVIADKQLIDIRLDKRTEKEKNIHNGSAKSHVRIISLRIGMKANEVIQTAGLPDNNLSGVDYYYSNRHRVEITQGEVSKVEFRIKKGLEFLDWIRLNFSSGGLLLMNITLAFIMFGVALEIKVNQFKKVISQPKSFLLGFFSQFIALPLVTFLLILIIRPSSSIALGMILVAACPGGNISNFLSSYAKANIELSVSLTAVATLSAIVLTPLNFALWGGLYSGTSDMVIPIRIDAWEMMKTVFILLGIPIILGVWFSAKFPNITRKIIKPFKIFSLIAFSGFVAAALASNFSYFLQYIHLILLLVFAHNLLALATGYSLASIFKVSPIDRRTLTIETGIQNSGLALVLIFNPALFNGLGGMAFVAAWWGIWHILSGLGVAAWLSKRPL